MIEQKKVTTRAKQKIQDVGNQPPYYLPEKNDDWELLSHRLPKPWIKQIKLLALEYDTSIAGIVRLAVDDLLGRDDCDSLIEDHAKDEKYYLVNKDETQFLKHDIPVEWKSEMEALAKEYDTKLDTISRVALDHFLWVH